LRRISGKILDWRRIRNICIVIRNCDSSLETILEFAKNCGRIHTGLFTPRTAGIDGRTGAILTAGGIAMIDGVIGITTGTTDAINE
jgi:hypothetical protein